MFFSIIMPIYNAATFLRESVNSIVSQDFDDYECLLIDDGSKDDSLQIMRELAEQYSQIRIFSHENHGPAYTRNVGIGKAQGEYLLFIDSDDCYVPGTLRRLHEQLSENHPDVLCFGYEEVEKKEEEICQGRQYAISEVTAYNTKEEVEKNGIDILEKRVLVSSTCNKAYARDMLVKNKLRLPENIYLAEDLSFNISVLEYAESYLFVPEVYYRYIHRNETSIIKRFKKDKYDQLMLCHEKRNAFLQKYRVLGDQCEILMQMDYIRICFSCFMDLFLQDCTLQRKQKLDFVEKLMKKTPFHFSFSKMKFLSWKEKIIYLIFSMKNKHLLYATSAACYALKFRMGMSF